ncbi:MAG: serine protease [Methanoregula sp.]
MPTWGEILQELNQGYPQYQSTIFDIVRRKYLVRLANHSRRNCILYATNFMQPGKDPHGVSINDEDIQGLMEVIHGLTGQKLDLILHSPGGSPEAAAAIVSYLRSKFSDIRVIIPHEAMSAATMICCASNRIVMGRHSFIGPIDPQFILQTQFGMMSVPAQAILDQFEKAQEECKDPQKMGAWLPILSQYGPALLVQSQNAIDLSKKYVLEWLEKYMFSGVADGAKARAISESLSDHTRFKSHGHHINRDEARRIGLVVDDLESDQVLQDLVLSVYHSTTHTFSGTPAIKIIENQNGRSFVKIQAMPAQIVQQPPPQQQPSQPPQPAPQPPAPSLP